MLEVYIMKRCVYLLLIMIGMVSAQSLVRVWNDDVAKAIFGGYDVVYIRGNVYADIVAHPADTIRMLQEGIDFEIIIPDMVQYYASRLDKNLRMGGYRTCSEIVLALDSLHTLYPNIVADKESIAAGWDGHILWAVKISDNVGVDEDEPEVLYDACIHAREVITPEVLLYFMHWLCENYGTDPIATYLVNNREMWFIPLVNPDGYVINETYHPEGGGMWRKNTRDNNSNGVFDSLYDGVDMNRNFGYMWGTAGASTDPSSETYMGPDSFSEPEIQGYRSFVLSRHFRTNISYHSYSGMYLFPWGYTTDHCPDHDYYMDLTGWMAERNGYVHGNAAETIYLTSGATFDWMYGTQGIISLSPEVGGYGDGFWPPTDRIVPLCESQWLANVVIGLAAGFAPKVVDFAVSEETGDGDSYPDVGETVRISVLVKNFGLDSVSNVVVVANPLTDGLTAVVNNATVPGTIAPKGGVASGDGILLQINRPIMPGDEAQIELVATTPDGYWFPDTFSFVVGTFVSAYEQDFDSGWSGWSLSGDWQIGTPTAGPHAHSEPNVLATNLSGNYSDNTRSEATSPYYYISPDWGLSPALIFWHWYSTEYDGSIYYDGGYVEIRTSSSGWTEIEPVGGYPAEIYSGNSYVGGHPGFSGAQREWKQVRFDLSPYVGDSVQFRFVFGSDPYVNELGWYIDDIQIGGYAPETTSAVVQGKPCPVKIEVAVFPNPFNSSCRIEFGSPVSGEVAIIDINGRVVHRRWLKDANKMVWSPVDVSSGVYLIMLNGKPLRDAKLFFVR